MRTLTNTLKWAGAIMFAILALTAVGAALSGLALILCEVLSWVS